jgi:hypothetical protein
LQPAKRDAIFNLEYAVRELRRKRGDVITIVSESIPITAIQCYTLMLADDVQMITILIVLFSSTVFGAKMAGLGAYHDVRMQRDEAETEFQKVFSILPAENETLSKRKWSIDLGGSISADLGRGSTTNISSTFGDDLEANRPCPQKQEGGGGGGDGDVDAHRPRPKDEVCRRGRLCVCVCVCARARARHVYVCV